MIQARENSAIFIVSNNFVLIPIKVSSLHKYYERSVSPFTGKKRPFRVKK